MVSGTFLLSLSLSEVPFAIANRYPPLRSLFHGLLHNGPMPTTRLGSDVFLAYT
jgi:hypothetical protein